MTNQLRAANRLPRLLLARLLTANTDKTFKNPCSSVQIRVPFQPL